MWDGLDGCHWCNQCDHRVPLAEAPFAPAQDEPGPRGHQHTTRPAARWCKPKSASPRPTATPPVSADDVMYYDGDGLRRNLIEGSSVVTYVWDGSDYFGEVR